MRKSVKKKNNLSRQRPGLGKVGRLLSEYTVMSRLQVTVYRLPVTSYDRIYIRGRLLLPIGLFDRRRCETHRTRHTETPRQH